MPTLQEFLAAADRMLQQKQGGASPAGNLVPTTPQPVANQTPMSAPALPTTLGQAAGQGGGIGQTLANMGKSFLGTAAETIPTAIFNAALFGDNPQSRAMTYSSMVDQLRQKRKKAEERKLDKRAALATYISAMHKYGFEKYNLNPEDVSNAIIGDYQTGIPEFDSQTKQQQQTIKALLESGDLDAIDLDEANMKAFEYEKMVRGDVLSEKAFGQQVDLAKAKQKPTQEPAIMQSYRNDVENFGFTGSFADWKKSQQKPDKPEKPDKPVGHWVQKEDGTYVYQTTEDKPIKGRLPDTATEKIIPVNVGKVNYQMTQKQWNAMMKNKIITSKLDKVPSSKSSGGFWGFGETVTPLTPDELDEAQMKVLVPYLKRYGAVRVQQTGAQEQATNVGGIKEGQTATNPKTGEKIIFKGGKWQPATK